MSTVSVTNVKNASSSVNNAVTTSGGDFTNAAGVSFMGGSKNLLYNGACQIAQRNTSVASITTLNYYTADRWYTNVSSLGTWTQSVEADGPTGSGLTKSLKMLCTTADASPAAADYAWVEQRLEGQDLQRIAKGTSSAQQLTLSFWVKSNVTGTYVAWLYDNDNNRHVGATYTVSASATWEKKSVTFPADTVGAFDNDNALSLYVRFFLGVGSDRTSGTLATSWATFAVANSAVGQTNLAAATNNYWQVTGVQLEVGPVATSFEFKSYGQELRECQRYYQVIGTATDHFFLHGACHSTTTARGGITFPVTMRIAPTTITFPAMIGINSTNGSVGAATMTAGIATASTLQYTGVVSSGLTAGNATLFQTTDANGLRLSAEL